MKKAGLAALVVIAAAALVISGCGTRIEGIPSSVATVNGEEISANDYIQEVHERVGKQVLQNMIQQDILVQWAKQEKVPPTQEQIDKQIENLKRDGIYDDQVKFMGKQGLDREMRSRQAMINVSRKLNKISDSEARQQYKMMEKQVFVRNSRKRLALITNSDKSKVEDAAKQLKAGKSPQEVGAKFGDRLMTPSGVTEGWLEEGQNGGDMYASLEKASKKVGKGEVSSVFKVTAPNGPVQYAVIKVLDEMPKLNISYDKAKQEVMDILALQKAYMDPDFQKKLNARKKKADIKVNIPEFESIAQEIKNPPPPSPMMMGGPGGGPVPAGP